MVTHTDDQSLDTAFINRTPTLFVYVKIPVNPHHRADPFHQRENELALILQNQDAGSVIGWGESVSDAGHDGTQHLMHQRIDITTINLDITRHALRTALTQLAVPPGTEIHYTEAETMLMDVYSRDDWRLHVPCL
ncbi:hypothetical protein LG201_10080 [Methylobacillus gramineus]|uniref:hypothetical protein n=1 Tax=Methylobacillus gramineus TaxID=755169 RepID=UPI001CFFEBBD|nr:hypothetical protein [Methylobacillus gramineus]MCB5185549.1 hypothetical protein [Methylobacillus gramineus]